jgi:hypothetical protein
MKVATKLRLTMTTMTTMKLISASVLLSVSFAPHLQITTLPMP